MVESPSSRRAWIEMLIDNLDVHAGIVAFLAEGVDRNPIRGKLTRIPDVAFLAEGVDRNGHTQAMAIPAAVAFLAEGVDRNTAYVDLFAVGVFVAFLAEGVDRNSVPSLIQSLERGRLPRGGRG